MTFSQLFVVTVHLYTLVCILYVNMYMQMALTALFNWLVRHVSAVPLLVAHFINADTLPTAALEVVRTFTFTHCRETRVLNINPNLIVIFGERCLLANK